MNTINSHIFTNTILFTYEHNLFTYEYNLNEHISYLHMNTTYLRMNHNQFTYLFIYLHNLIYNSIYFSLTQCSHISQSISILDTRMSMSERCHSIFQHIPFVVKGRQRYFGHTLRVDLMSITEYDIELGNS